MVDEHSTPDSLETSAKSRYEVFSIMTEEQATRFWTLVDICPHGAICGDCCWEWQGRYESNGYGRMQIGRTSRKTKTLYGVHRLAYFFSKGDIASGLFVCHSCDNRLCVQPAHLFLGTHDDNMRDARQKNRLATGDRNAMRLYPDRVRRGEENPSAKMTAENVQHIRTLQGYMRVRDIAPLFGLHYSTVARIVARKTWAHLPGTDLPAPANPWPRTNVKLTAEDVRAIRRLAGTMKQRDIAKRFGICDASVSHIISRKNWADLPDEEP